MNITHKSYEKALQTIERLINIAHDSKSESPEFIELIEASDIVEAYETEHYPIGDDINVDKTKCNHDVIPEGQEKAAYMGGWYCKYCDTFIKEIELDDNNNIIRG